MSSSKKFRNIQALKDLIDAHPCSSFNFRITDNQNLTFETKSLLTVFDLSDFTEGLDRNFSVYPRINGVMAVSIDVSDLLTKKGGRNV